jgi:2-oxoglutaroyl-CoA hydrolase
MDYPAKLDGMRWEKSGKAGIIIFDRLPMNIVSFQQRSELAKLVDIMDRDPKVRVIVIRGANGVYSSGSNIAGFLVPGRDQMHDPCERRKAARLPVTVPI